MNNNEQFDNNYLPDAVQGDIDFRKEIQIDDKGLPALSRRAVARLAGVDKVLLEKLALFERCVPNLLFSS